VILDHPKVSTLAKKWVDRVSESQVLENGLDTSYLPKDHLNKKKSDKGLKELIYRLSNLWDYAFGCENEAYVVFAAEAKRIAMKASNKLYSIRSQNDSKFSKCKDLFIKFSALLLDTREKFQSVPQITFNITKTKLNTMNELALVQEYMEFKQNFSIKTKLPIEFVLNTVTNKKNNASRGVDINMPFNHQSVLTFFMTTLIWEGVKRLLRYVTTYYTSKRRDEKSSIISKLNDWSYNLLAISKSDLFRYLCSELNNAGKAYIIQQIFLCATHQSKSFLKMMSSAIKFYYLEPTKAIQYDNSLSYVLKEIMIENIEKLVHSKLSYTSRSAIPNRLFYGPLDAKTDGETIYGGYIILNNRYRSKDSLSKASSKVVLVHELAHLIMRLDGSCYNFMKTSPKNSIRIQLPGVRSKYTTTSRNEIGEYIETQLFGFTVRYINQAAIEFLNDHQSWFNNIAEFKEGFTSCIKKLKEEKVPLKRYKYQERSPINNTRRCVYRHLGFFPKE
jgi:hypothetical protein